MTRAGAGGRRRPGWRRRLLLALGAASLSLLLGEAALRLAGGSGTEGFRLLPLERSVAEDPGRYRRHPERWYALAEDYRHAPSHAGRDATGAWPFRGPPPEPRPTDSRLVAVVGDSCVYGAGLDVAHTLPARLAAELQGLGLGPDEVLVANFGVPGYSTVQLTLLLDEVLARWDPAAVVLYPAAWNDQAPALLADDASLLARAAHPPLLDRLRAASVLLDRALGAFGDPALEEVREGWRQGEAPLGARVPEGAVEQRVAAMVAACREAGAGVVVLAAPHPPATRERHPRTGRDAAAVLRAATRSGVPALDGQAVLAAALSPIGRGFSDYVHPSPEGTAALARALAPLVAVALQAAASAPAAGASGPSPHGGAASVTAVSPSSASCFGDVWLTVELAGPVEEPLSVSLGGAPLLDLSWPAPDRLRGLLMANAPGRHDLVLRSRAGVAVLREAVELLPPTVTLEGTPPEVVFRSRPGDRCRAFAAPTLRAVPAWSPRGAWWLPEAGLLELPQVLVAGADGSARHALPGGVLPPEAVLHLQGLAVPPGGAEGLLTAGRWTAPARFGADGR